MPRYNLTNDHYLLFLAEINIKQQDGFKLRKLISCQFSWSSFTLWVNYKKENINTQAFSNVKLLNVSYKMLHWTAKTLGIMITMISMGGIMLYMWVPFLFLAVRTQVKFNPGFFFLCSKAFSQIIFSVIFRASNHQLVDKKN